MKKILYSVLVAATLLTTASCKKNDGYGKNDPDFNPDTTGQTPKNNSDLYVGTVTDCEDNKYPLVKIGDQYWMAENLRCAKYDTESEKPGVHIYTTQVEQAKPYYVDPIDIETPYSSNLTSYHRQKLGYLYNWAAAMALDDREAEAMDLAQATPRQGICPNGFHLPTQEEMHRLQEAVGGAATSCIRLKATTGWFVGDSYHASGTDDYGFECLPAGYSLGPNLGHTGMDARFWTATPVGYYDAYQLYFQFYQEESTDLICGKNHAVSVRCVKN